MHAYMHTTLILLGEDDKHENKIVESKKWTKWMQDWAAKSKQVYSWCCICRLNIHMSLNINTMGWWEIVHTHTHAHTHTYTHTHTHTVICRNSYMCFNRGHLLTVPAAMQTNRLFIYLFHYRNSSSCHSLQTAHLQCISREETQNNYQRRK